MNYCNFSSARPHDFVSCFINSLNKIFYRIRPLNLISISFVKLTYILVTFEFSYPTEFDFPGQPPLVCQEKITGKESSFLVAFSSQAIFRTKLNMIEITRFKFHNKVLSWYFLFNILFIDLHTSNFEEKLNCSLNSQRSKNLGEV